jgi:hypothetical protein
MTEKNKPINEDLMKLVIMRVEAAPTNWKLSIGSFGSLSKEEIIAHIKKGDEIGSQIVNSHLAFLKAVANGEFTKAISSV